MPVQPNAHFAKFKAGGIHEKLRLSPACQQSEKGIGKS